MKTNRRNNSSKTQPVTPEALVHIAALAERDSQGCEERCVKYSRHSDILRTSVALCLFVLVALVANKAYANQQPYTVSITSGTIDITQANKMVTYILEKK